MYLTYLLYELECYVHSSAPTSTVHQWTPGRARHLQGSAFFPHACAGTGRQKAAARAGRQVRTGGTRDCPNAAAARRAGR